jgi:hypothetical protein
VEGTEPRCPAARELAARVNQLMNRQAVVEENEELRVYWSVETSEGGVTARFRLTTREGEELGVRLVRSPDVDCGELRERFALVLALMLDVPPRPVPPPEKVERTWAIESEIGSTLSVGWLPQPRAGAEATLRFDVRGFVPWAIAFTWWPPSRFETGSSSYELRGWTAMLAAQPPVFVRPWGRVSVGAGIRAGLLHGRGVDFPSNWSSSAFVLDAEAELAASVRCLGPIFLRGAAGPLVPIVRPRVVFTDAAREEVEAHHASALHGFLTLSLVGRF